MRCAFDQWIRLSTHLRRWRSVAKFAWFRHEMAKVLVARSRSRPGDRVRQVGRWVADHVPRAWPHVVWQHSRRTCIRHMAGDTPVATTSSIGHFGGMVMRGAIGVTPASDGVAFGRLAIDRDAARRPETHGRLRPDRRHGRYRMLPRSIPATMHVHRSLIPVAAGSRMIARRL